MKLTALVAIPLMLTGPAALADLFHCGHSAPHRLSAPVNGATRIVVIGRAGSLRVTGSKTASLTASGTACSSDREFLSSMRIEARRDGSDLILEAIIPQRTVVFGWHDARLDLEVSVPDNVPMRVKDGSGAVEIRNVAELDVVDGSGELEIRGVRGKLTVEDGSGSISIEDVAGDVELSDGSGSVDVARVRGSVHILEDGSGGIDIRDVQRDVTIDRDRSGSIDVDLVGGNLTVGRDGSGGVRYDRVSGTVRVPRER